MKQPIRLTFTILVLLTALALTSGFRPANLPAQSDLTLDQFDLLAENEGWIRMGSRIFWTQNTGQAWEELAPVTSAEATILDVSFLDETTGWTLFSRLTGGEVQYSLANTSDRGKTWDVHELSLFEAGEYASFAESAEMGWLDANTGWIAVRQFSGINFSTGTLFMSTDAGQSWERSALPLAENVRFESPLRGWASGGPGGNQILRTLDGGQSWEDIRPASLSARARIHPPLFSGDRGVLVATDATTGQLLTFTTQDFGTSWQLAGKADVAIQSGALGLSILNNQTLLAILPGTDKLVRMRDGLLQLGGNSAQSISALDIVNEQVGWAKWSTGSCNAENTVCTTATGLLHTQNGGQSWEAISLPAINADRIAKTYSNPKPATAPEADTATKTPILIGQGFDACEIPMLTQMQDWWDSSPYEAVNLYIGGSMRACDNASLDAEYLAQLSQQGWKFIPTWVGPQAPCTSYLSRISPKLGTAFDEGMAEANAAVEALFALGLTNPDKSGSVVYYDMEYYGVETKCREFVNDFMNGWVSRLRELGNQAGVYGSTACDTGLSDFRSITHVPDVIWPARWYHTPGKGSYNPEASVWDLGSCLPDTVWNNHQRIRQYEGWHDETWGTVTLNIDNDVLDGVVAAPASGPYILEINRKDASPTSAQSVDFTVIFSEPVTGVDATDFKTAVSKLTGTAITNVSPPSGPADTYTVTVTTGFGDGTLRLDVNTSGTNIQNQNNQGLSGGFKSGGSYSVKKRIALRSQGVNDGWILESDEFSNIGGALNRGNSFFVIGDNAQNKQYRAILSFNTADIPDDATIERVILKVKQFEIIGESPFTTHFNLLADIRWRPFSGNQTLQLTDFQAKPGMYAAGVFNKTLKPANWYQVTLKSAAKKYVNKKGVTQFRLRFGKDDNDDLNADFLRLFSGNHPTVAYRPLLIVDYYVP